MTKITILFSMLVSAAVLASAGCDNSDDNGGGGSKAYPAVGSRVDVQYRRDYLGLSMPAEPTGVMGQGTASSGTLARMTDEFVVLQVDNEPTRELWIPRGAILFMDVKKKQ